MAGYITSVGVQQVTITIAGGSTSGTATISAVGSLAFLMYGGHSTAATQPDTGNVRVTLTNSTTITATRNTSTGACTIKVSVVDATSSLVTSVQFGSITITSGNASNTASISAVGVNTTVLQYLGYNTADTGINPATAFPRLSYSGTTVTSTLNSNATSNNTVSFCVIEFASSAMNQNVQSFSKSWTAATSSTQTITSVDVNKALLFWAGETSTSTASFSTARSYAILTNGTTVTVNNTTTAPTNVLNFFVVEFVAGVLNSNVQRGTIALVGVASNTATITSVGTTIAGCHMVGFQSANSTENKMMMYTELTNSTTVTGLKGNTAQNSTASYEIAEFSSSSQIFNSSLMMLGMGS